MDRRNGRLPKERIAELDALDIVWNAWNENWEIRTTRCARRASA